MAKRTATKGMRGAVSGGGRTVRAGRPEYELHLRNGINTTDDRIEAELRSPALDRAMHPKGAVHVNVNTDVTTKPKISAVLDAFHLDSLAEYVRGQEGIRAALAKALIRDQREWDPDGPRVTDEDVWARVKIESLELRRLKLADADRVAELKRMLTPQFVKLELADCDEPKTRSAFTVVFECDWDDEHTVRASFRDGKLIDVDHQ